MKLKNAEQNGMTYLASGELVETKLLAGLVPNVEVEVKEAGVLTDYKCLQTLDQLMESAKTPKIAARLCTLEDYATSSAKDNRDDWKDL